MWPIERPPRWVDRARELAKFHDGIDALRHDRGMAVWIEGEPGIGKSALVAEALGPVNELGGTSGGGSQTNGGMFLSRRTVQTYISHILAKLGVKSRVEIAREALRHGVSP